VKKLQNFFDAEDFFRPPNKQTQKKLLTKETIFVGVIANDDPEP
jgi:hypothetical protein